jgi:hypothetical protein
LVFQQQAADPLLDRRLLARERAQVQETAAAEQDGRDEGDGYTRRRDDREPLPQHSTTRGRLTHGRGRYTTRRAEDKRSTTARSMRWRAPAAAREEGVES